MSYFRRVQNIVTRFANNISHDDFRKFLDQPGNEELNSVFVFVEKIDIKPSTLFAD